VTIAILTLAMRVKRLKTRAEDDGPNTDLRLAFLHIQFNCGGGANLDTLTAASAIVHIDDIGRRDSPRRRAVDGPPTVQVALVSVGSLYWANLSTQATVVAQIHPNVAWLLSHRNAEISRLSLHANYLGVGQDLDVGM
jgi:hypothetical protein